MLKICKTHQRNILHLAVLTALFPLVLTGCGGGSGSLSLAGGGPLVSGAAVKGLINGATVRVYELTTAGTLGGVVGSGTTDASGKFSFHLDSTPTGPVAIVISGGSYKSETSGKTVTGTSEMCAMVVDLSMGRTGLSITPLSDMVCKRATTLAGLGTKLGKAIGDADTFISGKFGLKAPPEGVEPIFTSTELKSSSDSGKLALILATLDALRDSGTLGSTGDDIYGALSKDYSDGLADGKDGGIGIMLGTGTLPSTALTTDFAGALTKVPGSAFGDTALTASDMVNYGSGVTTGLGLDATAITSYFNNFSAEIALVPTPTPTDPALLAFFDNTSFNHNGENLGKFLQKITPNPTNPGGTLSFADITLNPVPTWVITVPPTATASYKVHFTVLAGGLPNGQEEFIMYKNSTGNWIALGDQKVAKANIEALATSGLMNNANSPTRVYCTGLWPQINDNGATGIRFAVVTGPGLPSAGLLLFANGPSGNDFTLAAGDPSTYVGTKTLAATTNLTNPNCGFNSLYPLMDTAIAAIAAGSQYTIQLYKDGVPGTPTFANGTPFATYGPSLSAAPLTSTQLTASLFPSAVTANPSILSLATAGGRSTISWTAPAAANLYASGVEIWISSSSPLIPTYNSGFGNVAGNATSTSIAITLLPNANLTGGTLHYLDNLFREYWTSF